MNPAPTFAPGPRVDQQGDRLVVTFRPRRSGLVFLGIWLTFWTSGGMSAFKGLAGPGWLFLAFWLCGWAVGELLVAGVIAWKVAGRDVLIVTTNQLEIRKQIGRFTVLTRRAHLLAIEDVLAERVPSDEDEKRTDFRLRIVSPGAAPQFVGEGMDEPVADHVASVVRSYVRPGSRWVEGEATSAFVLPAVAEPAALEGAGPGRLLPVLIVPTIIVVIGVVAWVRLSEDREQAVTAQPAAEQLRMPTRGQFHDPGAYAVAMTLYALTMTKTRLESTPNCDATVTWTRWTCRARGTSASGPFAGKSLVYRCTTVEDSPGILCGPDPRHRITNL